MANMTLTLPKTDLIQELTDKRDALTQEYTDEHITPLDTLIAEVTNAGDLKDRLVRWHKDIAKALKDGSVTVSPSGKLKGAPPRPSLTNVVGASGTTATTARRRRHHWEWYGHMSLDELKAYRADAQTRLDALLEPLTTAIRLLDMSTETAVEIQTADYQKLLSLNINGRYY